MMKRMLRALTGTMLVQPGPGTEGPTVTASGDAARTATDTMHSGPESGACAIWQQGLPVLAERGPAGQTLRLEVIIQAGIDVVVPAVVAGEGGCAVDGGAELGSELERHARLDPPIGARVEIVDRREDRQQGCL